MYKIFILIILGILSFGTYSIINISSKVNFPVDHQEQKDVVKPIIIPLIKTSYNKEIEIDQRYDKTHDLYYYEPITLNTENNFLYTVDEDLKNKLKLINENIAKELNKLSPEAWEKSTSSKKIKFADNPIVEGNKLAMGLLLNEEHVGAIEVYAGRNATFVSIKKLMDYLQFGTDIEIDNGRIYGWSGDSSVSSHWFILDAFEHKLTREQKTHNYNENQTIITKDDIYIDIELLAKYFSIDLKVDYSAQTIVYSTFANEVNTTIPQDKNTSITSILEKGLTDVGIEGVDQSIVKENNVKKIKIKEIIDNKTKPEDGLLKVDNENYLVFELKVNDLIYDDLINVYKDEDNYYIPMREFSDAMEFPLIVNAKEGRISGWYLKEGNHFLFDTHNLSVTSGNYKKMVSNNDFFITDDDIYLSASIIDEVFPINIKMSYSQQRVHLLMEDLLPFQAKLKREKYRQHWLSTKDGKKYELIETENNWNSLPFTDVEFGSKIKKDAHNNIDASYHASIKASTTIDKFDTNIFTSVNDDEIDAFRIKARSYDKNNNLFGYSGISLFEVGDVESLKLDLIGQRSLGRGMVLSNNPLGRDATFDTTTLSGDSLPGWEIELYSNTTLLDFQIVGENGRYLFKDVPIYYGNNTIRLVFYGPHGEIREESKQYRIDNTIIKKGKFYYQFGANQQNKSLLGINQEEEDGFLNIAANFEYGLTDRMTGSYGSVWTELDDGTKHTYHNFGITTMLGGNIVTKSSLAYDSSDGGWAAKLQGNTRIENTNVRFEHAQYNDLLTSLNIGDSDALKSSSMVSSNGYFTNFLASRVAYTLSGKHEKFSSGKNVSSISSRLNKSAFGMTFSNQLNAEFYNNSSDRVLGTTSVSGRYNKTQLRMGVGYGFMTDNNLRDMRVSLSKKVFSDYDTNFVINKSFLGEGSISALGSLNWSNDNYRVGAIMSADDQENLEIGFNISFSLYQDPRSKRWEITNQAVSETGAVSARAFLDTNQNDILDNDEEVLQNFVVTSGGRSYDADEDGSIFFGGLQRDRYVDILIDESSLDDPYWYAKKDGYTVLSRAGETAILDFPILESSEVEGTVYFGKRTVSDITLYLLTIDGKKVAKIKTEYDGFYIFEKVPKGEFTIMVSDTDLEDLGLTYDKKVNVSVNETGEVFIADDLLLTKSDNTQSVNN